MKPRSPVSRAPVASRSRLWHRIGFGAGIALGLAVLGWIAIFSMSALLKDAVVDVYQQTEMETVRSVARSIEYYVNQHLAEATESPLDQNAMEQELFRLFVEPVLLLQNGDAWIYAPDHVVYDQSGDFPERNRGKSMAQIFAIQKEQGAWHYEEMSDAVMNARPGVGWYVWLPEKGREIAAWTPVRVGPYVWTIGLSTPLPEILHSTGVATQLDSTILVSALSTFAMLSLLAVWMIAEIRRLREAMLTSAQKDLSTALSALAELDPSLDLCLRSVIELAGVDAAAFSIRDPVSRTFVTRRSIGPAEILVETPAREAFDSVAPRYMTVEPDSPRAVRLGVVPLAHGSEIAGYLVVGSRRRTALNRYSRTVVEAVAALAAGMVQRVRAEEMLRESEQRFRSVVDTAAEAIVAVDAAGTIVFWNPGAERTFGRKPVEALGMKLESLFAPLPAGGAADPPEEGASLVRREGLRVDGRRFPAELSSARWSGSDGEFTTFIIRDRTDQEQAELEREELEQKLQLAKRMESLGVLAGGVAHDLNNLLAPIVGYTDLLLQDVGEQSDMREHLVMLRDVGERASAVVQDLLTLGRRGSYQMSTVDLNVAVADFLCSSAFAETRMRFPEVAVDHHSASRPLPVNGSRLHLFKAFLNLALNACEAMQNGGVLSVSTSQRRLDDHYIGYETIPAGSYAVVEVRDTGAGIAERDLEHIFEPFFSRKRMGRSGTGLGLAVVYGVMHDHHGWVDVRTQQGAGTTFELWLPLSTASLSEEPREPLALGGTETVMLVEDQPEQRIITSRLLERAGYSVVAVENGRAAIVVLRQRPVDIIVLDMIMEDTFDGLDVYREAVAIKPGQKAIIVSGYAETSRVVEAQRLGAGRFIRKPFRVDTLLLAIREELEKADRR